MPPNNGGYNTNASFRSSEFPNEIRNAVKRGINPQTRRRGLEYLAGIKRGKQVEMPPKQAPKFKLGNFAGDALAELNAANARPLTQRNAKRAAILQKARNKGKNPAYAGIPYELNSNKSKTRRNGPNETPPAGFFRREFVAAENLGNKQNGMAANAELNNLLGGLPLANAPGPVAAKPAAGGKRKIEKWVTNDNAKETYYYDPVSKESMWNLPSGNINVVNGNSNVAPAPLSPVPQNNTNSNNTGTGSVVGKNIKQQINLKAAAKGQNGVTNVGGESIFANNPYNLNFKNRKANNNNSNNTQTGSSKEGMIFGGNIQRQLPLNTALGGQARATNVGGTSIFNTNATAAPAALVGNAPGEVISTNSTFIEGKSVVPDFQVKIRDGSIVAKNGEVTVVATSLEKMPAGYGLGSGMGLSMPGMPSMPKFSMPRFSGPKIDLSWLKLPNFGHFKLPETDILGMLGKFLAALPTVTREQIVAALKKGGKFIGIVLISPLLLAAWLYDHGFNLNIKLDGLTGGLISLEDFFLGGNQPAVKEIGRKLKIATDIAKRVVTNTIAEQEFLQKQINDKTRTAESVKQQILASLDSQIANIKTTLANLSADIKQVTVDPEYDNLIDEIDFEGYKGNNTKSANANLMAELNLLLDSIQKAYEGMALGDEATVAQKNVEKFKQIRKNFDDMLALPQKIRDEVAKTAASGVGAKLKELGRDARSRTAKLGYNVGQFFSRGATRVASMFGRGQKFSNANRTLKNAAAARNNVKMINNPIGAGEKKPSFFNRLKGFGSRAAGFFSRKKSPNVAAANRGLNAFKSPALRAKYPAAAAAAYTRKNRRHH
jgi:hypothetical protein